MIEQQESLDLLDRATWRAWQVSNVLLWTLAGIAAAFAVHAAIANIDTIIEQWIYNGYPSFNSAHPWLAVADPILAGAAIGMILGRRVFRSAPAYAGMAAAISSLFLNRFDVVRHPLGLVATIVLYVGAAIFFASRAEKHKPLALRGGRASQ